MALSKKKLAELDHILADINRAIKYLKRDDIIGIATATKNPTGADFIISNEKAAEMFHGGVRAVSAMNKFAGSDIAGLYMAGKALSHFIANERG